jgi:hypothetical protein
MDVSGLLHAPPALAPGTNWIKRLKGTYNRCGSCEKLLPLPGIESCSLVIIQRYYDFQTYERKQWGPCEIPNMIWLLCIH